MSETGVADLVALARDALAALRRERELRDEANAAQSRVNRAEDTRLAAVKALADAAGGKAVLVDGVVAWAGDPEYPRLVVRDVAGGQS